MKRRGFLGWMFGAPAAAVAGKAVADAVEKLPAAVVADPVAPLEIGRYENIRFIETVYDLDCVSVVTHPVNFVQMDQMLDSARSRLPWFVIKK